MAKNTLSSAFRKIDVDQYNEDNFREDEQSELQSPPAGPDEGEVTQLLQQGVLKCHLKNPVDIYLSGMRKCLQLQVLEV
ncbi:UNVERIFIED_CONTAM: hypothetical protein PYX00_006624 [Menopon gallinae]|uniref:Actin-related protein 2/3 complex subunit 5 n=1 Tax=Menopon gallinae TaxID=328185 RepID=A0AAW2HWM9_9NEOP